MSNLLRKRDDRVGGARPDKPNLLEKLKAKRRKRPKPDPTSPSYQEPTISSMSKSKLKLPSLPGRRSSRSILTTQKSVSRSSSQHALLPTKRRKRNHTGPSRLESLPLEILTMIFLESLEISLPQASPTLASRLSSSYIITKFIALAPSMTDEQITRLLRCRLFTWDLVRYRPALPDLLFRTHVASAAKNSHFASREKEHIRERTGIIIPAHIVGVSRDKPAWTGDRIALLKWYMENAPSPLLGLKEPDANVKEAAYEGLWLAVEKGNAAAVILLAAAMCSYVNPSGTILLQSVSVSKRDKPSSRAPGAPIASSSASNRSSTSGASSSTSKGSNYDWHYPASQRKALQQKITRVPVMGEKPFGFYPGQTLLRHAVLASTPDTFSRATIVALVHFDRCRPAGPGLDLLDPQLWVWAENDDVANKVSKARAEGDSNGKWLEELLKLAGNIQLSEWFVLAFCKSARRVTYDKFGLNEAKVGWLFGAFLWEWMGIFERVPH